MRKTAADVDCIAAHGQRVDTTRDDIYASIGVPGSGTTGACVYGGDVVAIDPADVGKEAARIDGGSAHNQGIDRIVGARVPGCDIAAGGIDGCNMVAKIYAALKA